MKNNYKLKNEKKLLKHVEKLLNENTRNYTISKRTHFNERTPLNPKRVNYFFDGKCDNKLTALNIYENIIKITKKLNIKCNYDYCDLVSSNTTYFRIDLFIRL